MIADGDLDGGRDGRGRAVAGALPGIVALLLCSGGHGVQRWWSRQLSQAGRLSGWA